MKSSKIKKNQEPKTKQKQKKRAMKRNTDGEEIKAIKKI